MENKYPPRVNTYTPEEVALLYDMFDVHIHNVNNYALPMEMKKDFAETSILKLKMMFKEDQFELALDVIGHCMASQQNKKEYNEVHYLIYNSPLSDMPLYINIGIGPSLIAKWRLKIGK